MVVEPKFLADENVEKRLVEHLLDAGFDVALVADTDPAVTDEELIDRAKRERRILLTNDKDFGELTFIQKRISTGIVLLRVKGQAVAEKIQLLDRLLHDHRAKLSGHFVVVTKKKIRFIPMGGV